MNVSVNIVVVSFHTMKKNTEALAGASKEIGLEVTAGKTKYMVMPRDQNAERSQNIKFDNRCVERVRHLRYLGTTLGNQNSIQEEIKSRLNAENTWYLSVQIILSSSSLSHKINIRIPKYNFAFCFVWL